MAHDFLRTLNKISRIELNDLQQIIIEKKARKYVI